ncbi:MAG: hypothetical protein EHM78_05200 [Myxococcaceae bacterium]|nr:MAG: hypothetical protein EHM78_05200 [Myxococcaceae bacterium]
MRCLRPVARRFPAPSGSPPRRPARWRASRRRCGPARRGPAAPGRAPSSSGRRPGRVRSARRPRAARAPSA